MTASISFYNNWASANSEVVPRTATFKVTLHSSSYTFAATHQVYADLTNELSTANGYTNGGAALGSVTFSRSGNVTTFDAADTVWTASGGSIVARRAVIRAIGTFNSQVDPLVASILLDTTPGDVTTTTGNTLTLQWNASGLYTITAN
jgi:hypothetical protein